MTIQLIKKIIHYSYLKYQQHFPVDRGKYRLGVIIDALFGKAQYRIDNISLYLSPISLIDRKLITGEGHDENVIAVIKKALQNGGNFIDVGANIGYMSLIAAKQIQNHGFVYSFEPSPREFNRLVNNIILNKFDNIRVIAKGIGNKHEVDNLFLANMGNPGMNSRHIQSSNFQKIQVAFTPVESEIPDIELKKVRCIKIDVEGDEYSVLEGFIGVMELLKQSVFIVEITKSYLNKAGKEPEDIYDFFQQYSFFPIQMSESQSLYRNPEQYDEIFTYDPHRK